MMEPMYQLVMLMGIMELTVSWQCKTDGAIMHFRPNFEMSGTRGEEWHEWTECSGWWSGILKTFKDLRLVIE